MRLMRLRAFLDVNPLWGRSSVEASAALLIVGHNASMIHNTRVVFSLWQWVLIVFTISRLESEALTSSLMMSGSDPTSICWIISLGVNAGILTQSATKAKTSYKVLKCTLVNLVCVTEESHWQHCVRLPQTTADIVSANGEHFEHLIW